MESFGVLDLLFFTEYTQRHCRAQHIMGLMHHSCDFTSTSLEEQERLDGHSLHLFSLPTYDRRFLFDIHYQQDMDFPTILFCVVIGLCTQIDLPDQTGAESFVGIG